MNSNKENEMINLTRFVVEEFLKTNESNIELSNRLDISKSSIQRRLTDKDRILKAFGVNGNKVYELVEKNLKLNQEKGKIKGNIKSKLNNGLDNGILNIDIFFNDEEKKYKFLKNIALTFRLKFDSMCELFNIDINDFINKMNAYNGEYYFSFKYLNDIDKRDQKLAKLEVINYYKNLFNSKENKNIEMTRFLLKKINDYCINEIINKYKSDKEKVYLKDEEIDTIIKYQIKYAYSHRIIASTIGINEGTYSIRANKYLEDKKELKTQYEDLSDYNKSCIEKALKDGKYR